MSRLLIPRLLTTGSVVGAVTAARAGAASVELIARRTPPLVSLALRATLAGPAAAQVRAQATFRDELIALARDGAELSWREMRRGIDQLDAFTRPPDPPSSGPPRRPYRVKP